MDSILADYKTADIDEKLRAMLAFLEKVTLHPSETNGEDAAKLLATGVSRKAAEEALRVSYVFNIHDRMADALKYDLPKDYWQAPKALLSKRGYTV